MKTSIETRNGLELLRAEFDLQDVEAAWFIGWNEPSEISKELDRRKFDSAT